MISTAAVRAALLALALATSAQAQLANPAPADSQGYADKIATEVAQIRGLPFKQPVRAETQSTEQFNEYVEERIGESVPDTLAKHYGAIVRKLGLYRGPQIEDFSSMMSTVMTSQVAAYYDPDKQRFFVVMSGMPDMMQGVVYSHELYHALQDQYFGLANYMGMGAAHGARKFNGDVQLARQAVVEGEATYMMTLWMMQKMAGRIPPRDVMKQAIDMQANMSMEQIRSAMKKPEVASMMGSDMKDAVDATEDIPPFIIDTMIGAYFKGLSFVFAVQEQGWPAVEKLYTDHPPQSTEHILHPEKWLAREAPVSFEWPKLDKVSALRGWELLDSDVLGEFQWRIIFKEFEMASANSATAGWGGDRYAVFKRKDSDALLLLLRTAWDSEAQAQEFAAEYRRLLAVKYEKEPTVTRVEQKGVDVFIVEGGDEKHADALLKYLRKVKPQTTH